MPSPVSIAGWRKSKTHADVYSTTQAELRANDCSKNPWSAISPSRTHTLTVKARHAAAHRF